LITAAALILDIVLYLALGWRLGGDAPRYLDGAQRLLSGQPLTDRQLGYVGYIGVLAAFQSAGFGNVAVTLCQLGLSLLAGYCAYALGCLWSGWRVGLLAGLMWVLFIDVQRWNFYLLTDGPFMAAVMICCYTVARARTGGWVPLAAAVVSIGAMAVLRINGVFFAAFFFLYLAAGLQGRTRRLAAMTAMVVTLALTPAGWQLFGFIARSDAQGALVQEGTYQFLVDGHVIWNTVFLPMPPPEAGNPGGPLAIVAYAAAHPWAVIKLYTWRLGHYVLAYNPLYSSRHLLVNIVMWPIVYALTLVGLRSLAPRSPWAAGLVVLWMCQGAIVTLTAGDFDGRYSLYAVPALLPFVAEGLDRVGVRAFGALGRRAAIAGRTSA
jgi:hypothetical protein